MAKRRTPLSRQGVLNGSDTGLTDQEKAMAGWARRVARDPNGTTPADIQALRDAGLTDDTLETDIDLRLLAARG